MSEENEVAVAATEAADGFSIDDLASKETTSVELVHPVTEELTGVVITGYTPDSSTYRALEKKRFGKAKELEMKVAKGGNTVPLEAPNQEERRAFFADIVIDITGIKGWEATRENITALFGAPKFAWMAEQWEAHLDDRTNFFS